MKSIIYVMLCLLCWGCQKKPNMQALLHQAETLMYTRPDSAYTLLNTIEKPEHYTVEDYATWCLLWTQAADKSFREHTSDSLIRVAVHYFEKQPDLERLAMALYTQGRVEKELGKTDQAIESFVKALDIAKKVDDCQTGFLASSQLGHIYAYANLPQKAFTNYEKALHFAQSAKDSVHLAYTHAYLGRVYGLQENWDKSITSYRQAVAIAEQVGHLPALRLGLNELAAVYSDVHHYKEAFDCLHRILDLSDSTSVNNRAATCLTIGDLYRKTGDYELAIPYLEQALHTTNLYTKQSVYQCYTYMYEDLQDYQRAVEYNGLYWSCHDSILRIRAQENVAEIEALYQKELTEQQLQSEKQLSRYKNLLILAIAGLLLISIRHYYRMLIQKIESALQKKADEKEKVAQRVHALEIQQKLKAQTFNKTEKSNERLTEQNKLLKEEIRTLKKKIEVWQSALNNSSDASDIRNRNILYRIHQCPFHLKEKDWDEFWVTFQDMHPDYVDRLHRKHPNLTKEDIRYCCLFKLNYSTEQISVLLGISKETVLRRKSRIKQHLNLDLEKPYDVVKYLQEF